MIGGDLGKLPFAIGLSRASARIIRQDLVIALGVIAILLIASGFGVIPLNIAVLFHEGSTIVVVLNALRLLAWREPSLLLQFQHSADRTWRAILTKSNQ